MLSEVPITVSKFLCSIPFSVVTHVHGATSLYKKEEGKVPSLEMAGLPEALSVMPPPCQAGLTHLQVGTSKSETLPWLPLSGCNL